MSKKKRKLRGTVQKVIKPPFPAVPEKAQIGVEEADDLYREIRIENVLLTRMASRPVSSQVRR